MTLSAFQGYSIGLLQQLKRCRENPFIGDLKPVSSLSKSRGHLGQAAKSLARLANQLAKMLRRSYSQSLLYISGSVAENSNISQQNFKQAIEKMSFFQAISDVKVQLRY